MSTLEAQNPPALATALRNGRFISTRDFLQMATLGGIGASTEHLPDELTKATDELNAEISVVGAKRRELMQTKSDTLTSYVDSVADSEAKPLPIDVILADAQQDRLAAFEVIQEVIRLNYEAVQLSDRCQPARQTWIDDAHRRLEPLREKVAKKLEAAGMGLEAQPGWNGSTNGRVEHEFRQAVDRNTEVAPLIHSIKQEEETRRAEDTARKAFKQAHREALAILQAMTAQALAA